MNALGANGYFRKPSESSEFITLGQMVRDVLDQKDRPPAVGDSGLGEYAPRLAAPVLDVRNLPALNPTKGTLSSARTH